MDFLEEGTQFGQLALAKGLLTAEQLADLIETQGNLQEYCRLGEIAVEKGYLSPLQLDQLLEAQEKLSALRAKGCAPGAGAEGNSRPAPRPLPAPTPAPGPVSTTAETRVIPAHRPDTTKVVRAAEPAAPRRPPSQPPTPPIQHQPPPAPTPPAAPAPAAPLADAEAAHPLAQGPVDPEGVRAFLKAARGFGASDLHLQADCRPFVRYHGELVFLKSPPLTPQDTEKFCRTVVPQGRRNEFFGDQDLDFCFVAEGLGRYRTNLFRDQHGFGLIFRIIPAQVPTLEELGLPTIVRKFTEYSQGLVLITGPAGCGKSSTMAALVDLINQERKEHVITVEDPIEYVMPSKKCLINQREVPRDTASYARALRAALREDPDIIMIGEMRDLETISLAITAAETGHLVFSTLHTRNAIATIDRMIDVFPPAQQAQIRAMVSVSLRGVVTQVLVRGTGGQRRFVASEVLFNTPAIGNLIRDSRTFQIRSQMQTGKKLGMRLLDESLKDLVRSGQIAAEAARPLAENPSEFS